MKIFFYFIFSDDTHGFYKMFRFGDAHGFGNI